MNTKNRLRPQQATKKYLRRLPEGEINGWAAEIQVQQTRCSCTATEKSLRFYAQRHSYPILLRKITAHTAIENES